MKIKDDNVHKSEAMRQTRSFTNIVEYQHLIFFRNPQLLKYSIWTYLHFKIDYKDDSLINNPKKKLNIITIYLNNSTKKYKFIMFQMYKLTDDYIVAKYS